MELKHRTPNGVEHGLINTLGNSVPDNGFKRFAEKDRVWMEKEKKEKEKMVNVRYLHAHGDNPEGTQQWLERPYMEYEGQPITVWRFLHDHVYTIPKGLMDMVNKQPALPRRSEIVNQNGKPTNVEGKGTKIHRFVRED
jgi:hypothetical protein